MSTEPLALAELFTEPARPARVYRLVRQILADCFAPSSPLVPPERVELGLPRHGSALDDILDGLRRTIVRHAVHPRHPWALAHMVPPPATASVLADLIIGAMNQCAFIWEEAPLAHALEQEVVRWLMGRLELRAGASGFLTSGGTMSNLLATFAAIQQERIRHGTAPHRLRILASDQAHLSLEKAAILSGLGADAVIQVRTDEQGRLVPGRLRAAAQQLVHDGLRPFLLVCTAGTTSAGVLEPVHEMLAVAREHHAWCHVDAAHGGLMSLCSHRPPYLAGWRLADSISWDPHKTLYTSYSVGALFFRDATAALSALDVHGHYALREEATEDAGRGHFEGSRRLEALKLWMTIKHFGVAGFSAATDKILLLARELAARIRAAPDFTLVTEPDTNIVCFRYLHGQLTGERLDRLHRDLQASLFVRGGPLLSTTRIHDELVLRAVAANPLLEVAELDAILGRIRDEARRITSSSATGRAHEHSPLHESPPGPLGVPRP